MQQSGSKKQGNGFGEFVALLMGFVFGLVGASKIVTEGKITSFELTAFFENNFGYLFMLVVGIFLVVMYIVIHFKNAVKLFKEKEWVNIFYPLWIFSTISPVFKYNSDFYLRVLPVIIPLITVYVLIRFNTKITGRNIKSYLSELFTSKGTV